LRIAAIPYYTINASLLQSAGNSVFSQFKTNVFIGQPAVLTPALFTFWAATKNDSIISISADFLLNAVADKNLMAKLFLLLVLNSNSNKQKILPIFKNANHPDDELNIEILKTYLTEQGMDDIEYPVFEGFTKFTSAGWNVPVNEAAFNDVARR